MIGVVREVGRVQIGELAKVTGTTARALRHYEQAGLISSERASNGYRVYEEGAAVRVRNIRYLLAAGLTLDDVRVFLPCTAMWPPHRRRTRVCGLHGNGWQSSTSGSPPRPRPATDWKRHFGSRPAA